jgi:hypothetical protein
LDWFFPILGLNSAIPVDIQPEPISFLRQFLPDIYVRLALCGKISALSKKRGILILQILILYNKYGSIVSL